MHASVARSLLLFSTFALFGTLACKQEEPKVLAVDYPSEMAEGYCTAVFGCTCDGYPYANITECFTDLVTAYDAVNDAAYVAGLNYDGACPARELAAVDSLACQGYVAPLPEGACLAPCSTWHGTMTAGFPCQVLASSPELGIGFSNCAQGLVCTGGVCVNPCQAGAVLPGIGQPCPQQMCAPGGVCDETTMTCVAEPALPGPGQPCANGVCDPNTAVCVPAANTCAALPSAGQACIEFACHPSAYCNADEFCIAREALACGLLGGGGFPGDGDGDPTTTGDGDGDPTATGDGDGAPGCNTTVLDSTVPTQWAGDSTAEAANDVGSCGGSGPEARLTYVAPQDGFYGISTEGTPFDTILYVRDGDCTGPELACDDDTFAPASFVEVSLSAGQEVTIFVDAYSSGGTYILSINLL